MNAASTELSSAKAARPMPSTSLRPPHRRRVPRRPDDRKLLSAGAMRTFSSRAEHRGWLESQATLPRGFRVGVTRFEFAPVETGRTARMALSLIALDRPTEAFAGVFTRNAFPGAPVIVGRRRMEGARLGAVLVNNKISNVCAPGGVAAVESLCAATASRLGIAPEEVLTASTGVIGWRLPAAEMIAALPAAVEALQGESVLPAAEGIVTTDLYPKVRRVSVGAGSIVGIAKGAGMIEPNLATMLVYLLTDLDVSRAELRRALGDAVEPSFNAMSIDTDTSTSDSVVLLASGAVPCPAGDGFRRGLDEICAQLAEDVARNGEGVHHVIRVRVTGAPDAELARGVGKSVVNSPLVKTAVCGNDPNVGRLVMAVGKYLGHRAPGLDLSRTRMRLGGHEIFGDGAFRLDPAVDAALVEYLRAAELYASKAPDGLRFRPPVDYPPHERTVDIDVDLGCGDGAATVTGTDLTHEYVTENADYRS
jgi:glutamate N-acetyltransferase / amino-acid N-acetyltransferase